MGLLDFDDGWIRYFNAETGGWRDIEVEAVDAAAAQVHELVDWIEERCVHRNQAENGLWTMHMMMGAYESARCHEVVQSTDANPCEPARSDGRNWAAAGATPRTV